MNARSEVMRYTALMCAVDMRNMAPFDHDHAEIVGFLVKSRADVNLSDINDETALSHAVRNGDAQVVEILAKAGADVNVLHKADDPEPPVMGADERVLQILVKFGADENLMRGLMQM